MDESSPADTKELDVALVELLRKGMVSSVYDPIRRDLIFFIPGEIDRLSEVN